MAIAGIEGLAQGFMQGMAIKRQNDRQDVLDAQNLEKFGMDKERFATQQAASAFDLQNAQTNSANAATDRTRALGIQAKGDAFHDGMSKIVGAFENGDMNGGYKALEQTTNTTGIGKGRFKSDASGNVMLDAKGNATWENLDANGNVVGKPVITDHKSAVDRIANAFNPEKYHDSQVATAAEITKEKRDVTNSIAKGAPALAQALTISRENNKSAEKRVNLQLDYKDKKDKEKLAKVVNPYLPTAQQFFGKNLKAEALVDMAAKMGKGEFIKNGIDSFNIANMTKSLTPAQKQEAQATMTRLADSIYGSGGNTVENSTASTLSLLNGLNATNTTDAPSGAGLDF